MRCSADALRVADIIFHSALLAFVLRRIVEETKLMTIVRVRS